MVKNLRILVFFILKETVVHIFPTIARIEIGPPHVSTHARVISKTKTAVATLCDLLLSFTFASVRFLTMPIQFISAPVYAPSIRYCSPKQISVSAFESTITLCLLLWKAMTPITNPTYPIACAIILYTKIAPLLFVSNII